MQRQFFLSIYPSLRFHIFFSSSILSQSVGRLAGRLLSFDEKHLATHDADGVPYDAQGSF